MDTATDGKSSTATIKASSMVRRHIIRVDTDRMRGTISRSSMVVATILGTASPYSGSDRRSMVTLSSQWAQRGTTILDISRGLLAEDSREATSSKLSNNNNKDSTIQDNSSMHNHRGDHSMHTSNRNTIHDANKIGKGTAKSRTLTTINHISNNPQLAGR